MLKLTAGEYATFCKHFDIIGQNFPKNMREKGY